MRKFELLKSAIRVNAHLAVCHPMPNIPLTLRMEVDPAHRPLNLVEADVIEPLKTSAIQLRDSVIWHEKALFPPHKYAFLLVEVWYCVEAALGLLYVGAECGEFRPVLEVDFVG
jgi:hypothetical protein